MEDGGESNMLKNIERHPRTHHKPMYSVKALHTCVCAATRYKLRHTWYHIGMTGSHGAFSALRTSPGTISTCEQTMPEVLTVSERSTMAVDIEAR